MVFKKKKKKKENQSVGHKPGLSKELNYQILKRYPLEWERYETSWQHIKPVKETELNEH